MLSMMFFGMDLFVLFEVLGPLERLVANFAYVRFEGCVDCVKVVESSPLLLFFIYSSEEE